MALEKTTQEYVFIPKVLTPEEKNAIHNKENYPIIAMIKGLSPEELSDIEKPINTRGRFFKEYSSMQAEWIKEDRWYYGEHHCGEDPKKVDSQFIDEELTNGKICPEFRIFFAAKFPSKIVIDGVRGGNMNKAKAFLRKTRKFYKKTKKFLKYPLAESIIG